MGLVIRVLWINMAENRPKKDDNITPKQKQNKKQKQHKNDNKKSKHKLMKNAKHSQNDNNDSNSDRNDDTLKQQQQTSQNSKKDDSFYEININHSQRMNLEKYFINDINHNTYNNINNMYNDKIKLLFIFDDSLHEICDLLDFAYLRFTKTPDFQTLIVK